MQRYWTRHDWERGRGRVRSDDWIWTAMKADQGGVIPDHCFDPWTRIGLDATG